jgi:hypothetical protein
VIFLKSDNAMVCSHIKSLRSNYLGIIFNAGKIRSWNLCLQTWVPLHWPRNNTVWLLAVYISFRQATQENTCLDCKEGSFKSEVLSSGFLNEEKLVPVL